MPGPGSPSLQQRRSKDDVLSSSYRSETPFEDEILARDLAECSSKDATPDHQSDAEDGPSDGPVLYEQPQGIPYGVHWPHTLPRPGRRERQSFTQYERDLSMEAERSLLRDNHILPPKHPQEDRPGFFSRAYRRLFSTKVPRQEVDEEAVAATADIPSETSPLLAGNRDGSPTDPSHVDEAWEAAVAAGTLKTTWQREAKTIAVYSRSLLITFLLQYSINVAPIFTVGRIGKDELGAVTLATMTINIFAYAPIQGLATSLDTLCAQAYGSGHKHLVGLQLQRMTYFLLILLVPIASILFFAREALVVIVPEPESAELAGIYLRVALLGLPGYVLFEGGKRFVQAQGLFMSTTWILVIAAPFNVLLNWLFVWQFNWGFAGAPLAVVVTQTLMPILLLLYVAFIDGSQCWGGFTKRALANWRPMIVLALPGLIMLEAEWMAFEILTLLTSQFGAEYLAAQSVLMTVATVAFYIPFPVAIAASTRIANLIGAKLVDAAKMSAKVAFCGCFLVAVLNFTVLTALRHQIPLLFTDDAEVVAIVSNVLPLVAFMDIFDCLATMAHGLLRGIGRQSIGGYANLATYYIIALPLSIGLAFGAGWKLTGLWSGVTFGLFVVASIEYTYMLRYDWEQSAREAEDRNTAG